jgi:hypothetical protein
MMSPRITVLPPGDAANRSMDQRPKRRSRMEFVTTLTEENAMAAAAIMGLRNPRAAKGTALPGLV